MTLEATTSSRTSISELPELHTTSPDDYIILQSDNISYKVQVNNISLQRNNINFYNEIAQLNTLTNTLSASIDDRDTQIASLSGDLDAISARFGSVTSQNAQLKQDLESTLKTNTDQLAGLAASNLSLKTEVQQLKALVDSNKADIDQKLAEISGRLSLVESAEHDSE